MLNKVDGIAGENTTDLLSGEICCEHPLMHERLEIEWVAVYYKTVITVAGNVIERWAKKSRRKGTMGKSMRLVHNGML
jgi:hypothetical protein